MTSSPQYRARWGILSGIWPDSTPKSLGSQVIAKLEKLVEFRQAVYDHGLTRFADAQLDLVDALLFSPPIRSFPELSLPQAFRRQWHSAYAAIEEGKQDWEWLEPYFIQLRLFWDLPCKALDMGVWKSKPRYGKMRAIQAQEENQKCSL